MANCCVCKRKIGGWGEEKYKIDDEHTLCYQCTAILRRVESAETPSDLLDTEEELRNRMRNNDVDQKTCELLEEEFSRIRNSKQIMLEEIEFIKHTENEIKEKRKTFLVTSGYNFEGYRITKYINLTHGEIVLGTGFFSELGASMADLFGVASEAFEGKMSQAKRAAQEQMIRNAMAIGANAIIGVDFDITTFTNNMIGVSANGTAVVVEKIAE